MLASVIVTNDLDLIFMYVSSFKSLMVFGMCVGEGGVVFIKMESRFCKVMGWAKGLRR